MQILTRCEHQRGQAAAILVRLAAEGCKRSRFIGGRLNNFSVPARACGRCGTRAPPRSGGTSPATQVDTLRRSLSHRRRQISPVAFRIHG